MKGIEYLSEVREDAERYLVGGALSLDLTDGEMDALLAECPKGTVKGPEYGLVWDCVADLRAAGRRVTRETVLDALLARRSREGGSRVDAAWLVERSMAGGYANLASLTFWAGKLADVDRKWRLRRELLRSAEEITTAGASWEGVTSALRTSLEKEEAARQEEATLGELLDATLADVERGSGGRPLPTPWANLNAVLKGGAAPGELVVLAARPGMGKTAMAGCWAVETARRFGPTLFVSCEVKDKTLGARLLAREGRVENRAFREGVGGSTTVLSRMKEAAERLRSVPLRIADSSCRAVTPSQVRGMARRLKGKPAMIVVDYLQLMYPDAGRDSREREIADMSRAMKRMSVELDCPVLLLSQLNRKVEEGRREPQLSDLRESGAVEQDADIVIMLHAESRSTEETNMPVRALVRKGRSSGTGSAELVFEKAFSDFREASGPRPPRRDRGFDL